MVNTWGASFLPWTAFFQVNPSLGSRICFHLLTWTTIYHHHLPLKLLFACFFSPPTVTLWCYFHPVNRHSHPTFCFETKSNSTFTWVKQAIYSALSLWNYSLSLSLSISLFRVLTWYTWTNDVSLLFLSFSLSCFSWHMNHLLSSSWFSTISCSLQKKLQTSTQTRLHFVLLLKITPLGEHSIPMATKNYYWHG